MGFLAKWSYKQSYSKNQQKVIKAKDRLSGTKAFMDITDVLVVRSLCINSVVYEHVTAEIFWPLMSWRMLWTFTCMCLYLIVRCLLLLWENKTKTVFALENRIGLSKGHFNDCYLRDQQEHVKGQREYCRIVMLWPSSAVLLTLLVFFFLVNLDRFFFSDSSINKGILRLY